MPKEVEYGFRRLDVWRLGMHLVKEVYSLTKTFPHEEQFALISQLRRAAISIPLNIAEGSARRTKKDFASFVRIASGFLMEVITCLEIALGQGYITQRKYLDLQGTIQELYFKLVSLGKFLYKKSN